MKAASSELIALLQNSDQFLFADFYSFTLMDGSVAAYNDKDFNLNYNGVTYRADSFRIDGMKYKISIGLDVDEQEITVSYKPTETIGGVSFAHAMRSGMFDGAIVRRSRAFYTDWTQPPVGVIPLFNGRVSTAGPVGRTEATVKIKSMTVLLDTLMPRNTYQTGCLHALFDPGCTLTRANYAMNWVISGGPTHAFIPVASNSPPLPAALFGNTEGLGIFVQGSVLFTSGPAEGSFRAIKSVAESAPWGFTLAYPLDDAPLTGDTFTIYPGCTKTSPICLARFNNLVNFRAFPYTPSAETAY